MVGLIAQLGEDALSSLTSEGQHRSLLMQQEQMHAFKETVDAALQTASTVMGRVTSSLFLASNGIPRALKQEFDKLSGPEEDAVLDSYNVWHQARYHRDKTAWLQERDVLCKQMALAQHEIDSLRDNLGSQSRMLHDLRESIKTVQHEKAKQTSQHVQSTSNLKHALQSGRSIIAEKHARVEELEALLHRERQHSDRVVRQAVTTLESMEPAGQKRGNFSQMLERETGKSIVCPLTFCAL